MKRMKFYRCERCGNIFWSEGEGEVFCCGEKQIPLSVQEAEESHAFGKEELDGEAYITFSHEMTKEHYIAFVAVVSWDRMTYVRLYPEQEGALRLPRTPKGMLYFYCSKHGLFRKKL